MEPGELQAMLDNDEQHWWYRGRRRVLRAELDRVALPAGAMLLDAGCGSGRTLEELGHYGTALGVDASPVAVAAARERGAGDVRLGRIEALPFADSSFDLVTCLDVIEHTPDDRRSLSELARVIRPGGWAIVTVPAHPLLWSRHDVVNLHYRRYRRADLRAAARAAGFAIDHDSYFNSAALAPAAALRLAQRLRPGAPAAGSDLERTPAWANALLELPLAAEARLLSRGRRVPAGLSLLAVLHRPAPVPVAPPVILGRTSRRRAPALSAA